MFRYIVIESKSNINIYEKTIISLFSEFMITTKIEVLERQIWIYFRQDFDTSLEDVIINLSQDTLADFRLYQSYQFDSIKSLEENRVFITEKLKSIEFNSYIFIDDHIILKHFLTSLNQPFRHHMLRKYNQDPVMLDTIKTYLESNQNMSVAAKSLFLHRNTLIQRIEKFYQATGFDIKKFIDGFLIYHLLLIK